MFRVKDVSSMKKNPQYNSICDRMHQIVRNILRTELNSNLPQNMNQARDIIDSDLATTMHATRTNIDITLGITPGALDFSRDMFLNIPLIANWQVIHKHWEHYVNENLCRANLKRHQYEYAQGQKVLKKVYDPTKLVSRTTGTYTIEWVHFNGTITIDICPVITKRINFDDSFHFVEYFQLIPVKTSYLSRLVSKVIFQVFSSLLSDLIHGRSVLAIEGKSDLPTTIIDTILFN